MKASSYKHNENKDAQAKKMVSYALQLERGSFFLCSWFCSLKQKKLESTILLTEDF